MSLNTPPIFLDYASTTPMSPVVKRAMEPYFSDIFYNPSALYLAAKNTKKVLEQTRAATAFTLGVRPREIIFTAGSTEANNLAIKGVMNLHEDAHCIVSSIEHDSVLEAVCGFNHSLLPVDKLGIVQVSALKALIQPNTVLISCMLANNELGTVQPVAELAAVIAKVLKERQDAGNTTPLYLHTDASQAFNYVHTLPHSLGADMVTIGGSKIYGPKQTAILFIKNGVQLQPLLGGGGQEWGVRSGTENMASIVGLGAAIEESAAIRQSESARLKLLQSFFIEQLLKLPGTTLNGSTKHRLPNNIHVTIEGIDNETVIMQLDEQGIMAAVGSACSASSDEPSHVLRATGMTDQQARSSIRFTMGRATTKQEIEKVVAVLTEILHR